MSLNDAIGNLSSGPTGEFTVTRTATGTLVKGHYTSGGESTFTIVAGIDPVSGVELQDSDAGKFGNDLIEIFTSSELRAAPKQGASEADRITYLGEQYQVIRCKRWDGLGEVHYEATAARLAMP